MSDFNNDREGLSDEEDLFWNGFNTVMGYLQPAERKVMHQLIRLCEMYEVDFKDACQLVETNPTSIPEDLYWAFREVDEKLNLFFKITRIYTHLQAGYDSN